MLSFKSIMIMTNIIALISYMFVHSFLLCIGIGIFGLVVADYFNSIDTSYKNVPRRKDRSDDFEDKFTEYQFYKKINNEK